LIAFGIIQDLVNLSFLFKWSWTTSYWWVFGFVKWALILSTFFVTPKLEPPQHYLMDCLKVTLVWVAFCKVWCSWKVPSKIDNSWYHLLLGNIIGSKEEGPISTTNLHPCCFYYEKNLLISLGFSLFFIFLGWRMLT
jgi:hypothetical protein